MRIETKQLPNGSWVVVVTAPDGRIQSFPCESEPMAQVVATVLERTARAAERERTTSAA